MNQDILEAFKSAMVRGYSIEITRQTLIDSGYPLQEIDEAVQFLKGVQPQSSQSPTTYQVQEIQLVKPIQKIPLIYQPSVQTAQNIQQIPRTIQKVSSYENVVQKQQKSTKEKGSKRFIIVLIILLAILLGALIAVLIFKDQLVTMSS